MKFDLKLVENGKILNKIILYILKRYSI